MKKITSFTVDHTKLQPGLYVSRVDGDVKTYDLRTRKPNCGDVMDNSTMHSVEHLLATLLRNSVKADDIIYFGPMGCQTGFYLLVRNADDEQILKLLCSMLNDAIVYDGPMPGESAEECGNYRSLDMAKAKEECIRYFNILKDKTVADLNYEK